MPCQTNSFPESSRVQNTTTQLFLGSRSIFQIPRESAMIYKGTESNIDHYSCFWDNKKQVHQCFAPSAQKHKEMGKVKVGPFCLDCWAKRKSIFFKKQITKRNQPNIYVTASHRVERDAYEERHNRSLHLWACLGCVRWYVWLWISFWNFCRIHIGVPYKLDASSYF